MKAVATALRNLRRAPAFTGLVVLTLALGIGATTAMFSVVDAVLINPLPFAKADRIVEVWTYYREDAVRSVAATSTVVSAIRQEPGLFEAISAFQNGAGTITGSGEPELVAVAGLAPSIFSVFPTAPLIGRLFNADDAISSDRPILISERIWAGRFGRDPGVIDRALTIDDQPARIVGVLPTRFNVPETTVSVWRPIDIDSANARLRVPLVGILQPGVTRTQLDDRLNAITASLLESGALPKGQYLKADEPIQVRYGRRVASSLYLLLGAVAVLLLVACVNITNLILVRSSSRRSELALMAALGAGRARLLRDAAIESAILALVGGALGVWLASGLLRVILGLAPDGLLMVSSATGELDLRSVAFALTLTFTTCLLFSMLPASRASRVDPIDALKQQSRSSDGGDNWWQGALVSTQLALVIILLAGAGLLLRSYVALNRVDLGFDPHGLVVISVQFPPRYSKGGASRAFMREVESRVEATIGSPASVSTPPLGFTIEDDALPEVEGSAPASQMIPTPWSIGRVSADFFAVADIPIVEGRTFTPDDSDSSIIVNDVFARRYFGALSPIGRRFRSEPRTPWLTVVGVAADIKVRGPVDAIGEGAEIYFPMVPGDSRYLSLMVRSGSNEAAVLARVRQVIWDLDPNMPILEAQTMTEMFGDSIARPRFFASLSGAFTICAVLIAAVGVYGVSAYWVARRRRELAIRLAVGATPGRLIRIVIARSLRLAAIGTIAGLAIAIAGARVMTALLFATDPRDPVTFIGIAVLLAIIAMLACLVPALKAARVDPMTTLRAE
jgi:putative ABC transport system permease protein